MWGPVLEDIPGLNNHETLVGLPLFKGILQKASGGVHRLFSAAHVLFNGMQHAESTWKACGTLPVLNSHTELNGSNQPYISMENGNA